MTLRTLVGIGCTSGLGYEALRLLLLEFSGSIADNYVRIIISARSSESGQRACQQLQSVAPATAKVTWLPLDLSTFPASVTSFSDQLEKELDHTGIDCLLLNAGAYSTAPVQGPNGYCQEAIVNHFAQHLLVDYLKDSFHTASSGDDAWPRIVYVSSSLQDRIKSADDLSKILSLTRNDATSPPASAMDRYAAAKLTHALAATAWKRKLQSRAEPGAGIDIVAVSPGFVPTTALNRDGPWYQRWFMRYVLSWAPFATSLHDGAASIVRAIAPPPEILNAIKESRGCEEVLYLGVKGETRHFNPITRDQSLEDVWCPSRTEMESWK